MSISFPPPVTGTVLQFKNTEAMEKQPPPPSSTENKQTGVSMYGMAGGVAVPFGSQGFGTAFQLSQRLSNQDWEAMNQAVSNGGRQVESFFRMAEYLMEPGREQELSAYLNFSADLSQEDLDHFLTAVKNSPGELTATMETAMQLDGPARSAFLEIASLSAEDLNALNTAVTHLASKITDDDTLEGFLTAAVAAGTSGTRMLEAGLNLGKQTLDRISREVLGFGAGEITDFVRLLSVADDPQIQGVMDHFNLPENDRRNMLKAAAGAGEDLDRFMASLDRVTAPAVRSQFLTTAANARDRMGLFLDLSPRLDLGFTASLSPVDTVNFLDGAQKAEDMGTLAETSQNLSKEDKSLFFYAAARTGDLEGFLHRVNRADPGVVSDLVYQAANQDGPDAGGSHVYMRGILSQEAYTLFSGLASKSGSALLQVLQDLDTEDHLDFLGAAAAAGGESQAFAGAFSSLSYEEKEKFLDISGDLGSTERHNFVQGALKSPGTLSDYVGLAHELYLDAGGDDGFYSFLTAAGQMDSDELGQVIAFTGKLDNGWDRAQFLRGAALSETETDKLITHYQTEIDSRQLTGIVEWGSYSASLDPLMPVNRFQQPCTREPIQINFYG